MATRMLSLYPKGWSWLGVLTIIALTMTLGAASFWVFSGADMLFWIAASPTVLLVLVSAGVVMAARGHYEASGFFSVLALLALVVECVLWSPYWPLAFG
jgi:hypothetical protein